MVLIKIPTILLMSFFLFFSFLFSDTFDSDFSVENSNCEYKNDNDNDNDNHNDNYSYENYDNGNENKNDNDNSRLIHGVVSLSPDIHLHLLNQDEYIERNDLETEDLLSHINQEEPIGDINPIDGDDINNNNLNNRDNIDVIQPPEVDQQQQQQQPAPIPAPIPVPADDINDEQIRILNRHNLLNVVVGQPPEIREAVVNFLRELGFNNYYSFVFLYLIIAPYTQTQTQTHTHTHTVTPTRK